MLKKAPHQETLAMLNAVCLAAVVSLALLVDGNGDIIGLSHAVSIAATVLVFAAASLIAAILIALGRSWRLRAMGIASLLLYLAFLAPLLF